MNKAYPGYSVSELCQALGVSVSTYYYQPVEPDLDEERMVVELKTGFKTSHETYGKRRLTHYLQNKGYAVGISKVRSLMKKHGLQAIVPKKKHYYPDAGVECKYAPNRLARQFEQTAFGTHFVGDITYIRSHEGWCYLACVLDLSSREIVGYATSRTANTELAKTALNNALKQTSMDSRKLLFHSDQGCQYSSEAFRLHLQTLGITQSMSRRGNCWDNAVMERFFRNLKTEYLNQVSILSVASANQLIERYIRFYNFDRLNSAVGYLTPNQKGNVLRKAA